ncbi:tetratricopeptide repeat protein [Erythrobacter sp. MTPC3]|uniref:tetratricopeptide repeat protein n=1 Tax=Erythrobacter sp. MTPC3 TaxID=3056564 RepID=UPI0036F3FBCF
MALGPSGSRNPSKDKTPDGTETSAEDEILMREIDDAVRQDDATQFARKYGVAIGSALVLGLAAFGGYLAWDSYQESQYEAQSETLVSALDYVDSGDFAAASEAAAPLLDSQQPGPRTAARFLQAGAALEQGNTDEAVELYAAVAADDSAPSVLRDLARVREVSSNFDEREPADIIARLEDLAVPGNAFFGSAGELTAIAHLEAGNRAEAGALFAAIAKDEEQPETLRSRARQMAGLLGVDAIEDVEQLLEDEGIDPEQGLVPLAQ